MSLRKQKSSNTYRQSFICFNCQDGFVVEIPKGVSIREYYEAHRDALCPRCGCKGFHPRLFEHE